MLLVLVLVNYINSDSACPSLSGLFIFLRLSVHFSKSIIFSVNLSYITVTSGKKHIALML